MNNPGKYDHLCTLVRTAAEADGAILMIINGDLGSGFSVQAGPDMIFQLPDMLETIAKAMREDLARNKS